jgi:hypothetical protein
MLDFVGTVLTAALMIFIINALVTYLDIGHSMKLALAGIAGLWIGLAAAASASDWLSISKPFPLIGVFVVTPLVAAAIATVWATGRAALLGLPIRLMIGLNIGRVLAVMFFLLGMQGRLTGPFPFFAGWGDIVTGVLAVPLLFLAVDVKHRRAIEAWNFFGAADLVDAIFLGVTSAEGSPLQLFYSSPGSGAMQYLPWSFIPTVLVPFYLIMHATVWAQLRRLKRMTAATTPAMMQSAQDG